MQQATATETKAKPEFAFGKVDLASAPTILVKFGFTNKKHLPPGVMWKHRDSDAQMDARHQANADEKLGEAGRHREGRVDTGEPVIKLPEVQVAVLRSGLFLQGYQLQDLHWYLQHRAGRADKFVVVCQYVRGSKKAVPPITMEALRSLATSAAWGCNVWVNPNGVTTINCFARQPGKQAPYALAVRNGAIDVLAVEAPVTEEQE